MQSGSFGDPTTLPSQEEVEERINTIFEKISNVFKNGQITKFIAFRYQSKGDESSGKAPRWGPVPFNMKEDARWKQDWRKPNPGMLNEAMKWAGISIFNKSAALMVGDMDADEGAAKAAGIKFQRAPEFFTRSIQSV
jgi:histidinol phosphatase-like enzyme